MKHSKKFLTGLLVFVLICSMNTSTASAADTSFSDVPANAWYADALNWCVEHDIMSGTTSTTYSPGTNMVRATVAEALYRAAGRPAASYDGQFSDVAADSAYASAVAWAAEKGIMSGYGGGVFGAENPVTREQLAAVLWRYAGSPSAEAGEDFADEASIGSYAKTAVDWARANGIINGRAGNIFDPRATIIRSEVTAILYRYLSANASASSGEIHTNAFDLEKGTVLLNNGMEMPILGIGTFALTPEQAENSVYWALKDGYKLIDTANAYNNEEGVARGIQRAISEGVKREDFFVTAKIWPDAYNMEGIDATLKRLGLEYVDLMLLHQPFGDITAGYQAMEQAVAQGKVKAIGLSNFEVVSNFERIMEVATIPPAVLQVETHPYFQQRDTMEYIDRYGTVIEAWYPLGGRGNTQILLNDETIVSIAQAHGKTAAQVILRWHLQAGHIAIPGSSNPDHILENISIFDFELTDAEMARMAALNTGNRFFNMPGGMTDEEMNDFIENAEAEITGQS